MHKQVNPADSVPSTPSLTQGAMQGMLWTLSSVGVSKLASFGAQLVLGWLLSANDFALYALAISSASIVEGLTNGGTDKVLVQRGAEYCQLASPVFRIAGLFNVLAAMALMLGAPLAAQLFDAPELPLLIFFIALAILLRTPSAVLRAKLTIDLQFKTISSIVTVSALIGHLSTVIFALLGFGPLSFVLPLIVVAVYEGIAFARSAKLWPRRQTPMRAVLVDIIKDARWIMVAAVAGALIFRGQYFVIGLLEDYADLGIYFFGYQLSVSLVELLMAGMGAVMLGTFAKLSEYPQRQAQGYLKSIRMLSFFGAPASLVMILLADPLVRLFWSGKWDAAIPVIQILLMSLLAQLLLVLSLALIEARGRWRLRALLLYAHAAGIMACAGAGAWLGGLSSIALWITGYKIAFSLFQCVVAGRLVQIGSSEIMGALGPPVVFAAIGVILSYYAVEVLVPLDTAVTEAIAQVALFLASFWLLSRTVLRDRYAEVRAMFTCSS